MSSRKVRPDRFAHIVIRTNRFQETIEWYRTVLHAWPAFENDFLAFITYDDEHHRLAFVNTPRAADPHPARRVSTTSRTRTRRSTTWCTPTSA